MAGKVSDLYAQPRMPVPSPVRQMERGEYYDPWGFPIDVNRPVLNNADGSISTERTTTERFNTSGDRPWLNVPTIVDGQELGLDEAIRAVTEGRNAPVGQFKTLPDAERAGQDRSNYLGLLEAFGALNAGGRNGR
ncbi:hypothetical protein [Bosea lathyri]|uniref:Uncharacterized protein n=1 Tax=Bosea lathyri TaxID=1036778 RepID=A0A1H6BWI4_9HYPH|nr:hypothetical protein [Bosea lathyri]SEG65064.1 hypothetical protein SAMN04488115_108148 [Bosea lathyri]